MGFISWLLGIETPEQQAAWADHCEERNQQDLEANFLNDPFRDQHTNYYQNAGLDFSRPAVQARMNADCADGLCIPSRGMCYTGMYQNETEQDRGHAAKWIESKYPNGHPQEVPTHSHRVPGRDLAEAQGRLAQRETVDTSGVTVERGRNLKPIDLG